jgi:hypothetical protein
LHTLNTLRPIGLSRRSLSGRRGGFHRRDGRASHAQSGDQRLCSASWQSTSIDDTTARLLNGRIRNGSQSGDLKWSICASTGVDTIIHIHAGYDNTLQKLDAVRARKPGDPNPFVNKDDVDRFMNLQIECAQAQLAWAKDD